MADTRTDREQLKKNRYRRKKAMQKRTHKRIGVAFLCAIVLMMGLGVRIIMINYSHGDEYSKAVLDHQSYVSTTVPYKRGEILTADGTVLAYSEKVYNLILDAKLILSDEKFIEPTLTALEQCFGYSKSELMSVIHSDPDSQYRKYKTKLKAEEVEKLQIMLADTENNPYLKGVYLEESYIRNYPFSTLACDVVGFSSTVNGGELGIENYYDSELSGTDGVTYSYVDENLDVYDMTKETVDGNNIITTLDYNVQSIIEKHIIAYNTEKPSVNTAVMVMDPSNGEILGMASYPDFDLNNPRDLSKIYKQEELEGMSEEDSTNAMYALWTNYCVSESYEPGSTFKPVTVAAGLEEGVIHDGDTFECKGYEEVADYKIGCHVLSSKGSHGTLTVEQAIMQSCNPALIQIAAKIGPVRFGQYQRMFGFGSTTGIDLPGETTGILYPLSQIAEIDSACNSFGQNLNVNMVQMMSAYCSIINDGNYYQPHIVKRIESANGEVVKSNGATLVRQTVTANTSKYLRRYLRATVETGIASAAGVTGYSVAGKTGTAEKGKRDERKWIISFLGHAPADDPKFAIYVIIDEPEGTTGTSGSSADVLTLTHDILNDLLPYMNVYKDAEGEEVNTSTDNEETTVDGIPEASLPQNNE
ncbi:MAG: penicillin-binding protein 2 [Eubacteriales bacterium]|nr:penicillin-binding protein 2 [Eubacteriales bacterium]